MIRGAKRMGWSDVGIRAPFLIALVATLLCTPFFALAGALGDGPGIADARAQLTPIQRAAAKALGAAGQFVDEGKLVEARAALVQVRSEPSLSGYADLVRIRILMKEGEHGDAYAQASAALSKSNGEALKAALGVLQGEALAMGGDAKGAELAWSKVLGASGPEDQAVRQSIELSIVASRQRTGSLDSEIDPLVLLDQNYADVTVSTEQVPIELLSGEVVLDRAAAALESGHPEQAGTLFDTAIAKDLDPERARIAKMGRARSFFRQRKYESATKAYRGLLPDVEARFWLARSLARSGDVDGSLSEFALVAKGKNQELASWALYLMATLHEDRDEMDQAIRAFRKAATFEAFPDRMRSALWREGWAQYRTSAYADARSTFKRLVSKTEDSLAALRPKYWAARAAIQAGEKKLGHRELESLAREFPLTYYGWRAQERLQLDRGSLVVSDRNLREGTRRVDDEAIERAALLIEAGLSDLARDELRFSARKARGFVDRTRVGVLLAEVGDYHRANELVVTAYGDSLARGLQPGRESLWWLSWPPAYRSTIQEVFPKEAKIEPELVWAIMREESHYRVDARSSVGALGLLQLMPTTAAQLARENGISDFESEDLFDPRTNITLGAIYLDQLATRFDGRLSAAIGSYNAGGRRVSTWLQGDAGTLDDDVWVEDIPYDQTRSYVKRVLRSLHVYKSFYR